MTKRTFLKNFREVAPKYYWHLDDGALRGYLRGSHNNEEYCPLTAVAKVRVGKTFTCADVNVAAKELDYLDDPDDIVNAADNEIGDTSHPNLRRSLLNAVATTLRKSD